MQQVTLFSYTIIRKQNSYGQLKDSTVYLFWNQIQKNGQIKYTSYLMVSCIPWSLSKWSGMKPMLRYKQNIHNFHCSLSRVFLTDCSSSFNYYFLELCPVSTSLFSTWSRNIQNSYVCKPWSFTCQYPYTKLFYRIQIKSYVKD